MTDVPKVFGRVAAPPRSAGVELLGLDSAHRHFGAHQEEVSMKDCLTDPLARNREQPAHRMSARSESMPSPLFASDLAALDNPEDALIGIDDNDRVVLCNESAERLLDLSGKQIEGRLWRDLLVEDRPGRLQQSLELVQFGFDAAARLPPMSLSLRRANGAEAVHARIAPISVSEKHKLKLVLLIRQAAVGACCSNAGSDAGASNAETLTGQTLFMDRLDSALQRHRRAGKCFALVLVDVRSPNAVIGGRNDRVGAVGERTAAAERRIRDCLRSSDSVARIGPARLGMILEQVASLCDVRDCVHRLRQALEQPPLLQELSEVRLVARIGLALYAGGHIGATDLLHNASQTLIAAERARRTGGEHGMTEDGSRAAADLARRRQDAQAPPA
jgi:GGDEF domain-containing protein